MGGGIFIVLRWARGVVAVVAADDGYYTTFRVPVFAMAAFPSFFERESGFYQLGNNIANSCCHARIILALCVNCKSFLSLCVIFLCQFCGDFDALEHAT